MSSTAIFIIIACIFVILICGNLLFKENTKTSHLLSAALYQKRNILTKTETVFYKNLRKALPDDCVIFAQVPFSCLLKPKDRNDRSLFWKINQKRVDFVVLDANLNTLFIVELDDKSHSKKKESDNNRDELFLHCGIPTYRFNAEFENHVEAISSKLLGKM